MIQKRVYSKMEIAALYFGDITPKSASRRLGQVMNNDDELMKDLYVTGYKLSQRYFTPRQVELLVIHLGDPDESDIQTPSSYR